MFDMGDAARIEMLIGEAIEAAGNSYAPFSRFHVGAAVLGADGRVFRGCNVENSSFSATNCAERTALFSGVACGTRRFEAIAIVGCAEGKEAELCYPCGVCRQVMQEFCEPGEFVVIVAKNRAEYVAMTLAELLPHGFRL